LIKSFNHKGLEEFYRTGSKAGIQPAHATKVRRQLTGLTYAIEPGDLNVAGWDFHPLKGDLGGHWSISVNGNRRLTFSFDGQDFELVNYVDYH
jgi:proteic killer suppression protein